MAGIGSEWWIYFDHYTEPKGVGAMRTAAWRTFENVTNLLKFPADPTAPSCRFRKRWPTSCVV